MKSGMAENTGSGRPVSSEGADFFSSFKIQVASCTEEEAKQRAELDAILEENRRKIEEAQEKFAEEQLKMVEEQRALEEERIKRRKENDKRGKEEQKRILGKNNARPKISFGFS